MNKEIWKDIVGYEGLYQVSNLGRVKNTIRDNILLNEINHGYCRVLLCKNKDDHKHKRVHILVAEAFLDKSNFKSMPYEDRSKIKLEDLEVNHKDENRMNANVNNLEWCTRLYNCNYGNCAKNIGKALSKKVVQMDINNNIIKTFDSLSDIGRTLGYGIGYISQCCNGRYKQAYGYKWRYADDI